MEDPRVVMRLFYSAVALYLVVAIVGSVCFADIRILLLALLGLGGFLALCGVVWMLYIAIFGPVLWLLSRLASKSSEPPGRNSAHPEH